MMIQCNGTRHNWKFELQTGGDNCLDCNASLSHRQKRTGDLDLDGLWHKYKTLGLCGQRLVTENPERTNRMEWSVEPVR